MARHSPPSTRAMPSVDAFVDGLGGLVIGLAAAVAGGIAHARNSPTAIATLIICGVVLSPFFIVATLTPSASRCVPIAVAGIVIVAPLVARNVSPPWNAPRSPRSGATLRARGRAVGGRDGAGEPAARGRAIGCLRSAAARALRPRRRRFFFPVSRRSPSRHRVRLLAGDGPPADEAATTTPSSQAPLPPRDTPPPRPPPPAWRRRSARRPAKPRAAGRAIPRANSKQGSSTPRAPSEASSAAA